VLASSPRSQGPVFFVHVPKTAGTTLTRILRRNEAPGSFRHVANVFKGGGGIKPPLYRRLVRQLRSGPRPNLLFGHMPLGIDPYLPRDWRSRYVTLLRDPVDRALSHYYRLLAIGRDRPIVPKRRVPRLTPDTPLEDALCGVRYVVDNVHTRMLCGLPEPFGEVTPDMLERAKDNLRARFVVFGLTERFDEFLVLLKWRFGYDDIFYRRGRVNESRPRGDSVPRALVESATHANRYDIELYDFACQLFDAAPELRQPEFQAEVAALRRALAERAADRARTAEGKAAKRARRARSAELAAANRDRRARRAEQKAAVRARRAARQPLRPPATT
jgi:hypothetical protein